MLARYNCSDSDVSKSRGDSARIAPVLIYASMAASSAPENPGEKATQTGFPVDSLHVPGRLLDFEILPGRFPLLYALTEDSIREFRLSEKDELPARTWGIPPGPRFPSRDPMGKLCLHDDWIRGFHSEYANGFRLDIKSGVLRIGPRELQACLGTSALGAFAVKKGRNTFTCARFSGKRFCDIAVSGNHIWLIDHKDYLTILDSTGKRLFTSSRRYGSSIAAHGGYLATTDTTVDAGDRVFILSYRGSLHLLQEIGPIPRPVRVLRVFTWQGKTLCGYGVTYARHSEIRFVQLENEVRP